MTADLAGLLAKWDSMFRDTIDPTRESRMEAILGVLGTSCQPPIRVLDLGTGPGPLAERVLERFSGGRVVGVDSDPVLLRVAKRALSRYGDRVAWVLADLRKRDWSSGLPVESFDASVSSLALHWLEESEIRGLYRDLRQLLRPGGLFVNGDFLPSQRATRGKSTPGTASDGDPRAVKEEASLRAFHLKWKRWWSTLEREPTMSSAFRERQIRMPGTIPPRRTSGPKVPATVESHERALQDAGFRGATVSWTDHGFRVLVATR